MDVSFRKSRMTITVVTIRTTTSPSLRQQLHCFELNMSFRRATSLTRAAAGTSIMRGNSANWAGDGFGISSTLIPKGKCALEVDRIAGTMYDDACHHREPTNAT